uniref:Secreted protein n=1 Tax=Oryza brachyantha TaxID=4533 RepID=J3LIE0_ORYBR
MFFHLPIVAFTACVQALNLQQKSNKSSCYWVRSAASSAKQLGRKQTENRSQHASANAKRHQMTSHLPRRRAS